MNNDQAKTRLIEPTHILILLAFICVFLCGFSILIDSIVFESKNKAFGSNLIPNFKKNEKVIYFSIGI